MDMSSIQNLLNDKFVDDDFNENELEGELEAILSGKPIMPKTAGGRATRTTTNVPTSSGNKSTTRQQQQPERANNNVRVNKSKQAEFPVTDPNLDISQIEKMLNSFDVDNFDDENIDDDDLLLELNNIVGTSSSTKPTLLVDTRKTIKSDNVHHDQTPLLVFDSPSSSIPLQREELQNKIPKMDFSISTEPLPLTPKTNLLTSAPLKDSNVTNTDNGKVSKSVEIKQRQIEYKRAALKAKNSGDTKKALDYLKVSKQLEGLLTKLNSGEDIDLSDLPESPANNDFNTKVSSATIEPASTTTTTKTTAAETVELPEVGQEEASQLFNAPTSAKSVMEALEQRLVKFKSTQEQANAEQNAAKARRLGRIVKQYETAIKDYKKGNPVDYDSLPCPPGFPPIPTADSKPSPNVQSTQQSGPQQQLQRQPPPPPPKQLSNSQIPKTSTTVVPPKSADTASLTLVQQLEQRMAKFQSLQAKAASTQDMAKARRLGRIAGQYQNAIKECKRGNPIDVESLPCPPGFEPLSAEDFKQNQSNAAASAAKQPSTASSTSSTQKIQRQMSTSGSKQLNYLLERQKLFREAALEAKKRGEIEQAKEYLRQMKGFDPLIMATKSGLPIDATSIPTPPQLRNDDDFVIINSHTINNPEVISSSNESNSTFYTGNKRDELFSKVEQEIIAQIEMCKRNKEYFLKMGDINTSRKFEKYETESRKDHNMLQVRWHNGDNIPSYRTETRTFSIVVSNPDVGSNEFEVDVVQALDLPGKEDLDTYIKVEFPVPTDKPQIKKTKTVYNTINPEYNESIKFDIDRKSRSLARIFKRHPLKVELFSKGGFLRSDTRLGIINVKLSDFETKCTIHDSFPLTDGRKTQQGKVELKLKLREPLLAKQVEEIKEKWITFS